MRTLVSRLLADFRADNKWHEYWDYCDALFFAVPPDFPQDVLPDETDDKRSRARKELSRNTQDSAPSMAKSVVVHDDFDWADDDRVRPGLLRQLGDQLVAESRAAELEPTVLHRMHPRGRSLGVAPEPDPEQHHRIGPTRIARRRPS